MKSVEAIKILHGCDLEGRILFRSRELGVLFGESGDTLRSTIKRLTADGILERIAHDAYLYLLFHPNGCDLLGHIAAFLRPGEVTYESLESAASQWGFISQIPRGRSRRYPLRCHRVRSHERWFERRQTGNTQPYAEESAADRDRGALPARPRLEEAQPGAYRLG